MKVTLIRPATAFGLSTALALGCGAAAAQTPSSPATHSDIAAQEAHGAPLSTAPGQNSRQAPSPPQQTAGN